MAYKIRLTRRAEDDAYSVFERIRIWHGARDAISAAEIETEE
jgi:hypothetical protein